MKRCLSLLLALVLALSFGASALAAELRFADVPEGAWYAQSVYALRKKGLMDGVGGDRFDPEGVFTRAQLATVPYRMAGSPAVGGEDEFVDTAAGQWYSDAVLWASQNGVVSGYGDGLFGTDDAATQEQVALMLWRNAGAYVLGAEYDDPNGAEHAASDWAVDAIRWARVDGLLTDAVPSAPTEPVSRALVADMVYRYLQLLERFSDVDAVSGATKKAETIDNWNTDSPAMRSIVEFVTASADETSAGYIPREDRIAVFDMDGTLYGERAPTYFNDWLFIQRALYDDSYEAPEELKAFARAWEDKVLRGIPIDDFDAKERVLGPQLYEGLTPDEYAEVVRRFKDLPVWGFEGMTYGEAYFQPMVSLVKYLYDHDYSVYIVSATYRDAVRVMTEGVLDEWIPYDHVIGTDLLYVASGDADKDPTFYELMPEDELVIAGSLFLKNQKTNKATMIQQEIGRVPVLAFGNSTGDFSMATYTLGNRKYEGRAYMLLCDDTERDYGDPDKAADFKAKCDANGFYTVSEKDEFAVLFPAAAHMAG